jgi:hypothetical protein
MLTENNVFPCLGRSNASQVKELSLQDRVHLRMCPASLTAKDILTMDGYVRPRDTPEEIQNACSNTVN